MSRAPLAFRTVGVRRMPGIADGGWELRDLSPGVNVVWGPNGAGKTTTAAALQRLLWPAGGEARTRVDARLHADGAEWRVEMDGADVRWQRAGANSAPVAGIPSEAERDRYRLSLHELLSETDGSLAERIVRESAGGFDVAGAADALGFRPKPGRAVQERAALDEARRRLGTARDEEAALRDDEARLGALRGALVEARTRAGRAELWRRALERLDARAEEHAAREALARIPAGVARLAGNETEQLRALRSGVAAAEERARAAAREAEAARREIEAERLPAAGLPGDVVPGLAAALARLQELEQTRDRLARELDRARAECAAEQASVAGAVRDKGLATLALPAVEELLRFAREAERHRAEVGAAEAELAWLSGEGPAAELETLRQGRRALAAWLRLPADDGRVARGRILAVLAALLLAGAGAVLGLRVHPAGYALAGAAALLLALSYGGARPAAAARAENRAEFGRLGLEEPARWEPEAVAALVERIERAIAEAALEASRAERRAAAERRLAVLGERTAEGDRRRAELAARLGLAPDADEAAMAWLCQRVHRWQVARAEAGRTEAELGAATDQIARTVEETERAFGPFASVSSPTELAGALEDLRGRAQRFDRARARLEGAQLRRGEAEEEAARGRSACAELLARAGMAKDADARLDELCALHPAFVQARRALDGAELAARTAERRLAEVPGFDSSVTAVPRPEAARALEESLSAAAPAEALAEEAAALKERLDAARSRTAIEEALARVEEAEAALREARDRDEAAVAGWALRDFVERATRDRDRPAVFHRARELFTRFTHGAYRLELSADAPPAFRAVDTGSGAGCSLDELSRGTRVQLLLAVRIAFIETMEEGPALPLVLDEALGNSDDHRAGAVMDAVTELARGGRQVFFLTARRDEAERWMARLGAAGVPHALVDLGEARRLARFAGLPRPGAASLRLGVVPAPEERDHAAYGELLRVPPVDPEAHADGVHLWYLVDDPARLHRLLTLGVGTLGSLRALVEQVGRGLLGPDEGAWERLDALGRAAEALLAARRIGRGRRVDEDALERSGVMTPAFRERIEDAYRACGGRAEALLASIAALPRFRTESVDAFREFLEREGYLDGREPLAPAALRAHLLTTMAPDLRAGGVTPAELERLADLLAGGVADVTAP